jgi:GntR family transcriptional regulator
MMVSRQAGRPLHLQIAAALRDEIRRGTYPPGAQLPTERALVETWKVAQGTVRAALAQLRDEGLLVTYQGRGVYVREQLVRRKVGADQSWRGILERLGKVDASTIMVRREPAPDDIAELLGLEAGTVVTVRDRLLRAEGEPPDMVSISWHPEWLVEQIPDLADPTTGGMKAMHEALGLRLHFFDWVASRTPTMEERERLDLGPGDVVTVQRGVTYDQDERPLYAILHIAAGHRVEFSFAYGDAPAAD